MGKKNTILLIEDDAFVGNVYQAKLRHERFEISVAENGIKAMEKLKKITPDVILLDVVMPHMDGKEVLKRLKKNKKRENIPTIVLTNLSQKEEMGGATKRKAQMII